MRHAHKVLAACCLVAVVSWSATATAALLAHYTMEETASPLVDQAGGQTAAAVDAGQLYGLAGPSGWGNAVGLNDNGAWQLSVADSTELRTLANDMSVAAWAYLDSAVIAGKVGGNAQLQRIMGDDVDWDADGWSWGVNDTVIRFTKNGIVDADDSSGVVIPTDRWIHLAVTVSSTDGIHFYLNGTDTGAPDGNTADMNTGLGNNGMDDPYGVGRSYGNGQAQWFGGNLDEVRVYDHVLTPDEVAALAIPEPASAWLLGLALVIGFAAVRRR